MVASHVPLLGTRPATQACALTGNQTRDPLVCRPALNALSHTSHIQPGLKSLKKKEKSMGFKSDRHPSSENCRQEDKYSHTESLYLPSTQIRAAPQPPTLPKTAQPDRCHACHLHRCTRRHTKHIDSPSPLKRRATALTCPLNEHCQSE